MRKALIIAAAMGAMSLPAFAQGTMPSGTRAGGPAQMGAPGQVGTMGGAQKTMPRKMTSGKKMMRKKRAKKMM